MNNIELYINDNLVEFPSEPVIALNYSTTDLTNPTVVKNSFSKTIEIEGTPRNNMIFNCFYDLRRVNGSLFNPSRKVPFSLYSNSVIIESGYVKLDNVTSNGDSIKYSITLFGGLGNFLYGLSFDGNGNKMSLADLTYSEPISFEANAETVLEKWNQSDNLYVPLINFVPEYGGVPENFSADKVLINTNGLPAEWAIPTSDGDYTTKNGFVLGTLRREMTGWEMRDIRVSQLRPAITVKGVFEGCMNLMDDYEFDIDSEFLESFDYNYTYITLPSLNEIKEMNISNNIEEEDDRIYFTDMKVGQNFKIDVPFKLNAECAYEKAELYTGAKIYDHDADQYFIIVNTSYVVQGVVYDKDDNIIGGTQYFCFYSDVDEATDFNIVPTASAERVNVVGKFRHNGGGLYTFNDNSYTLSSAPLYYQEGMYMKLEVKPVVIDKGTTKGYGEYLFNNPKGFWYPDRMPEIAHQATVEANKEKNVSGNSIQLNKRNLLSTESTPCDYFLGILKTFGMYIWKSPASNVIHIQKRGNYYDGELIDIDDKIDRTQMSITPLTFENKWLKFANKMVDSDLSKTYLDKYGVEYGSQRVDTNYNFDNSTNDLLKNVLYKGCVMERKKSKYFSNNIIEGTDTPIFPWMVDGCKITLFNGDETTEVDYWNIPYGDLITYFYGGIQNYAGEFGDFLPKPNFEKSNKPADGKNVLLYLNNNLPPKDSNGNDIDYYLTDDLSLFDELNEGNGCWISTLSETDVNGNTIAKKLGNYFPRFTRYQTVGEKVKSSLDFGTPQEIYTNQVMDDSVNIYNRYWKSYITDMYDDDTRIVTVPMFINDMKLPIEMLRKFYYFDGCYWILNQIIDYNVSVKGMTKCVFVKINDMNNYR